MRLPKNLYIALSLQNGMKKPSPKRQKVESKAVKEKRLDGVDYYPLYNDKPNNTRCKLPGCSSKAHV